MASSDSSTSNIPLLSLSNQSKTSLTSNTSSTDIFNSSAAWYNSLLSKKPDSFGSCPAVFCMQSFTFWYVAFSVSFTFVSRTRKASIGGSSWPMSWPPTFCLGAGGQPSTLAIVCNKGEVCAWFMAAAIFAALKTSVPFRFPCCGNGGGGLRGASLRAEPFDAAAKIVAASLGMRTTPELKGVTRRRKDVLDTERVLLYPIAV
eukprot:CAMPEP_0117605136 /NCGR_PEP_ID=MMETSP0784-20121206/79041_1 /TAXON_ID=39447 /ORGANISM="" /LENGTH=202 /DNA_ID=CAMNT_0005408177 /DNA_START=500 /DNA_END=1104 /DNA_ORIENTATION=-